MNASTIGQLAELECSRVRARDALFDWARQHMPGKTLDTLLLLGPRDLVDDYERAVMALQGAQQP